MATEITCVIPDGEDPGERIDAVGGPGCRKDENTVIGEIEAGREYFVEADLARVSVVIAQRDWRRYLRTDPDESVANNLLSLSTCHRRRPMIKPKTTLSILAAAMALAAFAAQPAIARDYDCADFATQRQAQRFFNHHHPRRDPYGLDADHDGIACESNP